MQETGNRYKCKRENCKYAGNGFQAWHCNYLAITGTSRIKWHRDRGLSEEPQNCRCYQKGPRTKMVNQLCVSAGKTDKVFTTGKVRSDKRDRKTLTTRKVKRTGNYVTLAPEEHEKRLALYHEGMSDGEIAAELHVSGSAIRQWRKVKGLPPQDERNRERAKPLFRKLYEAGYSVKECSKLLHVAYPTTYQWRDEMGLPAQCQPRSEEALTAYKAAREEVLKSLQDAGLVEKMKGENAK